MLKYLKFFACVIKHKAYVFYYCCKFGIPLRGLTHDWDKLFKPSIFIPYAKATFGHGKDINYGLKDGMTDWEVLYTNYKQHRGFANAVFNHKRLSKHHWEAWISVLAQGSSYQMSRDSILEMVADWISANKMHKDFKTSLEWYSKNKKEIQLHKKTRRLVEYLLKKHYGA